MATRNIKLLIAIKPSCTLNVAKINLSISVQLAGLNNKGKRQGENKRLPSNSGTKSYL